MTDDGGVVRGVHEITAADQRALVAQCTRCVLKDISWWLLPAAVAGVAVGLWVGTTEAVLLPLVLAAILAVINVGGVRAGLRRQYVVGSVVETVLEEHWLKGTMGVFVLPQVTRIRSEGRVLRIDYGRDHSHVLPDHVDVELLRSRAGVPAPAPGPDRDPVVVPHGLGPRAAVRSATWRAVRSRDVVPMWLVVGVCLLLGQWSLAALFLVAQVGGLVAYAGLVRRAFDRAFPPGIPLEVRWHGWDLVTQGARGRTTIDVQLASWATEAGELFVVRREGMEPLSLPTVVVSDEVRTELLRRN